MPKCIMRGTEVRSAVISKYTYYGRDHEMLFPMMPSETPMARTWLTKIHLYKITDLIEETIRTEVLDYDHKAKPKFHYAMVTADDDGGSSIYTLRDFVNLPLSLQYQILIDNNDVAVIRWSKGHTLHDGDYASVNFQTMHPRVFFKAEGIKALPPLFPDMSITDRPANRYYTEWMQEKSHMLTEFVVAFLWNMVVSAAFIDNPGMNSLMLDIFWSLRPLVTKVKKAKGQKSSLIHPQSRARLYHDTWPLGIPHGIVNVHEIMLVQNTIEAAKFPTLLLLKPDNPNASRLIKDRLERWYEVMRRDYYRPNGIGHTSFSDLKNLSLHGEHLYPLMEEERPELMTNSLWRKIYHNEDLGLISDPKLAEN